MEESRDSVSMIDMFTYPVFCVKNGFITETNHYAKQRQISVGTPIAELLDNDFTEYHDFCGCCMSLTLRIDGAALIAVVTRIEDMDVFHINSESINEQARAMSLVAQQMCQPLTDLLTTTESLDSDSQKNSIQRSLYQLQRITSNITAVNSYSQGRPYGMEVCNITAVFTELLAEAQQLAKASGRQLVYTCPSMAIYCPADLEILKKAIYNLISNAIKGSPQKGTIKIAVESVGEKIRFSIQNADNGLGAEADLFSRYLRNPQIEDGRHGIGLGLTIAQLAASTHNGVLLMDRPKSGSIRFTLTISTRRQDGDLVRSPIMQIDFGGGLKTSLVELSDVLPVSAFENI